MSLNHFTIDNQSSVQPWANPRFQTLIIDGKFTTGSQEVKGDLVVDGKLTASGLEYPTADNGAGSYLESNGSGVLLLVKPSYGTVGYTNGTTDYAVPVTNTSVVVSLNRNSASPSNNITNNPIGINIIRAGHYLVSGTVSFKSDTPGTVYAIGSEVQSVLGFRNFAPIGADYQEMSISEVRSCNANDLVTINLYTVAAVLTNVNVVSWNLTVKILN